MNIRYFIIIYLLGKKKVRSILFSEAAFVFLW